MWQTLRDNPEVVWGFLLALGVVLVLTPAVGRFARILGVVDQPGEARRLHLRPIPRLGGIALLLGIFVPALAFLELGGAYRGILLGAAIATCVGVVDDFRGLPWWGKLGGQVAAAAVAVGSGVEVDRFTFPFLGIQDAQAGADDLAGVVVAPAGNQSLDQFFKMLRQRNVHRRQCGIDAIYCQFAARPNSSTPPHELTLRRSPLCAGAGKARGKTRAEQSEPKTGSEAMDQRASPRRADTDTSPAAISKNESQIVTTGGEGQVTPH